MPDLIHFSCEKCGQDYSVDKKYSGKSTRCGKCGIKLIAPGEQRQDISLESAGPQDLHSHHKTVIKHASLHQKCKKVVLDNKLTVIAVFLLLISVGCNIWQFSLGNSKNSEQAAFKEKQLSPEQIRLAALESERFNLAKEKIEIINKISTRSLLLMRRSVEGDSRVSFETELEGKLLQNKLESIQKQILALDQEIAKFGK